MKTIELHYNVRVKQGHRFAKNVLREWPEGASLGDVMAELVTELQSLECEDITVTRALRKADETFKAQYNDRGHRIETSGTLAELSADYVAHCTANADMRHGPATLMLDGKEAGFISANGRVWLKQPSHVLAFDPEAKQ